jgi:hypothetical protein
LLVFAEGLVRRRYSRAVTSRSFPGFSALSWLHLAPVPGLKTNLWMEFNDLPFYATTSSVQAMNAALDKYYPGLRTNANIFSALAAYSWPSGLLLEDAVKAGGLTASDTPSAAEVVKGLESLKGDTLNGWVPPLTFAAGQPHPVDCWFTGRDRRHDRHGPLQAYPQLRAVKLS